MTKRPAASSKAQPTEARSNESAVKICFERIIPDELDPERMVRREMRRQMLNAAAATRTLNERDVVGISRMALSLSKKWPPGSTVRCRFLDGSAKMKRKVTKIAKEWENYADIKLTFVSKGDAEIRISFYADAGSWSAVGRDALNTSYFPPHQPTMNYGWLRDDSPDQEYHRVVAHEFGHALGCVHEHQSPKFTRKWNVAAVMKYFSGPPNYWNEEEIKSNVLEKYSPQGISATESDPDSIMLYEFDSKLFSDGLGATNTNTKLSAKDIAHIKKLYP